MPDEAPLEWPIDEEDDAFLMAKLYPKTTGLPMTVWVSERGGARHDVRVKMNINHGARAVRGDEIAVVAVRPQPRLLHGELARTDLEQVIAWIALNEDVILDYWTGDADTADLIQRLQRLSA